jgi:hypothetical protein
VKFTRAFVCLEILLKSCPDHGATASSRKELT